MHSRIPHLLSGSYTSTDEPQDECPFQKTEKSLGYRMRMKKMGDTEWIACSMEEQSV